MRSRSCTSRPLSIRLPPAAVNPASRAACRASTGAVMLATTRANDPRRHSGVPRTSVGGRTPLRMKFCGTSASAAGSSSRQRTSRAPSRAPARARMPEPAPTSSSPVTGRPGRVAPSRLRSSSSRARAVEGWRPVPNPCPGRITRGIRPSGAGRGTCQGGHTSSRAPTGNGSKWRCHCRAQSSTARSRMTTCRGGAAPGKRRRNAGAQPSVSTASRRANAYRSTTSPALSASHSAPLAPRSPQNSPHSSSLARGRAASTSQ